MSHKHLYTVELKDEGKIDTYDDRDFGEFSEYLKSGEATLLNGSLKVIPDDIIDIKELPNIDTQPTA